jgi:hypothetical protein
MSTQATHHHQMERRGSQFYSDGALKPIEIAANKAQAEAVVCDRCGKQVHPTNWMKHQNSHHKDDPKPLHTIQKDDLLPLAAIRTDGGTQPRSLIDSTIVEEYAEAMNDGVKFPSIIVFFDGQEYWLADGFHRLNAALKLDWLEYPADVRQGTQRDAILYSVGVNATHGLRRTNADKRRAVERLLRDEEWSKWSDREIARKCAVGNKFVGDIRHSLFPKHSDERTYTTKHGTEATMQTGNIGKPPVTRPPGTEVPKAAYEQAAQVFPPVTRPPETRYVEVGDDYQDDVPSVDVEDEPDWLDDALAGKVSEEATTDFIFQAGDKVKTTHGRTGGTVFNVDYDRADGDYVYVNFPGSPSWWIEPTHLVLVERGVFDPIELEREKQNRIHKTVTATAFAHHLSGSNEWYTPKQYIEAARQVMAGIDLDPASCEFANQTVKAKAYHDISANGLAKPWHGSVFLNPPYGRDEDSESNVAQWIARLLAEYECKNITEAILLVNATTERKWFQALWQFPICFTNHRINFYNAEGEQKQPTQGNAFIYLGPHKLTFAATFEQFGTIVQRLVV